MAAHSTKPPWTHLNLSPAGGGSVPHELPSNVVQLRPRTRHALKDAGLRVVKRWGSRGIVLTDGRRLELWTEAPSAFCRYAVVVRGSEFVFARSMRARELMEN